VLTWLPPLSFVCSNSTSAAPLASTIANFYSVSGANSETHRSGAIGTDQVVTGDRPSLHFVYFDPPYITRRAARIIRYQPGGFYEPDHRRLARYVRELDLRGCFVMVSNSEYPLVLKLYQGFRIDSLDVRRNVNADATARGGCQPNIFAAFPCRSSRRITRRMTSTRSSSRVLNVTSPIPPLWPSRRSQTGHFYLAERGHFHVASTDRGPITHIM
jgi:hypothetical protein